MHPLRAKPSPLSSTGLGWGQAILPFPHRAGLGLGHTPVPPQRPGLGFSHTPPPPRVKPCPIQPAIQITSYSPHPTCLDKATFPPPLLPWSRVQTKLPPTPSVWPEGAHCTSPWHWIRTTMWPTVGPGTIYPTYWGKRLSTTAVLYCDYCSCILFVSSSRKRRGVRMSLAFDLGSIFFKLS